jgi:hypothetical protein
MVPARSLSICTLGLALASALLAGPARASEIDPYLPDDTEIVLSLNVRQLLDAPVIKKTVLEQARAALKEADRVNDLLNDVGFDPFRDLDRVIIASPGGSEQDRGLVIAYGRYNLPRFLAHGAQTFKDNPEALRIHKVADGLGGHFLIQEIVVPNQDQSLFVALADRTTLLASPGKDYVVDALKRARRKRLPRLRSKEFAELLEKMDDRQTLCLAVRGSALAEAFPEGPVQKALAGVEAIGGGVTIGDDVKIEVGVTAQDAERARQFQQVADKGLKQAVSVLAVLAVAREELSPAFEIVRTLKVRAKGPIIIIKGQVSADVIEDALKKE